MTTAEHSSAPDALQPLRFPLRGSRLIEASAGTGKTFTIATLYVRLVLGHGDGETAFGRPLTPPEILVVTFTDAATKELRDRIRVRLAEAAAYFLAGPEEGMGPLHELRAEYPPGDWPGCARKLQLAAEWMDEAAVSTIHAWCNRMLREHAFDSDSLFTQALETDQSELMAEVVRDYWRSFMYPLDADAVAELTRWWAAPEALQTELKPLLAHVALLPAAVDPAQAIAAAGDEKRDKLDALKAPWKAWADALEAMLDEARAAKAFNGSKLRHNSYRGWLQKLRDWHADPALEVPLLTDAAWSRLTPRGLAEVWKVGSPPVHPALDALAALREALAALPDAREAVLRHAVHWVTTRFAAEQGRRAQMGFDDLLGRLAAALGGDNGERLAAIIRRQFPVALIDEFQDTDPVQYRIFDAVYRVAENRPESALILIGDPKQAIYAFRGADIHTYLAARRAVGERLYTLGRNYRSTGAMVAAANRMFAAAEAREPGEGAFLFRRDGLNPVPFFAAEAEGRKDRLSVEGAGVAALTVWHLPADESGKAPGKEAFRKHIAQVCASEMVRLLNAGQQGRAGFDGDGAMRALRPADMAVLVNNRAEADCIREALDARGVRSVYLSEKESVFERPQATEMQLWLVACAEPDDGRALRAALATATLGMDWQALDAFNHDELAWESMVLQFRGYRECWRAQGVLPMLRRMLNDFRVPARLLAGGGAGERALTDVLHLAELLQQASALLDGEHALIRYLSEQRQGAGGGDREARQIRLESDADLVQVVTVHKSKGLEYPLVFLPFACLFRATNARDRPFRWHDADGALQISLTYSAEAQAATNRERLGEDLRKLYVALTRARHATWVGLAPIKGFADSAIGYLLGGEPLPVSLGELAAGCDAITVVTDPPAADGAFVSCEVAPAGGAARNAARQVGEHWWIASYSALKTVEAGSPRAAETAAEEVFHESAEADAASALPLPSGAPSAGRLHDFPRGAAVGTFLHDLLEWAAHQGFATIADDAGRRRDLLARRCTMRGWEQWIDPLSDWLADFLKVEFQIAGEAAVSFSLASLGNCVAEMEFLFAAHRVGTTDIDRLVCDQTLDAAPRPPLEAGQVNGMLKGFIDLVVEHQGRYYVLDYKSNRLGADDAAYSAEAMRTEILNKRYELQYVLYLLALHRLLKSRLQDYDYEEHIGGALYLFLRGEQAPTRGCHFERPPRELIEALDNLFADPSAGECA